MFKAVLFDMDGVLVDSEEYICKAAVEMFREKGKTTGIYKDWDENGKLLRSWEYDENGKIIESTRKKS